MRKALFSVLVLAMVAVAQSPQPQPGVKLSVDEIKAQLRITAGKRLRPKSWPNGARVAVALSFDVDNVSASLA